MLNITAYAAEQVNIDSQVNSYFKITCLGDFVSSLVSLGITIGGIIMLIMLIWGGINWMISAGDKTKVQEAQSRLTHALIGLAIVAAAWAIWTIILVFFGIGGNICGPDPTKGGPPFTGTNIPPAGPGLQP